MLQTLESVFDTFQIKTPEKELVKNVCTIIKTL